MRITDSTLSSKIEKHVAHQLADIFFFDCIAVIEIKEGVHFDKNNSKPVFDVLNSHFGSSKSFGIVANRVNSYSINILDSAYYKQDLKNMKAYGVVGHDLASKMNALLENNFCETDQIDFETLYDAVEHTCERVKHRNLFSLN